MQRIYFVRGGRERGIGAEGLYNAKVVLYEWCLEGGRRWPGT